MEGLNRLPPRSPGEIFDHVSVIGEPLRCRILLLLEDQELTVSELCSVLQLPQSTVSRHLKALVDHSWARVRPDGTRRRYSIGPSRQEPGLASLWRLLREEVADGSAAHQDRSRLESVLAQRRTRSQEFFTTAAGDWAQVRTELFGGRFDLEGLLGLIDETWSVGDLGCGTGQTSLTLAPFVRSVVAVDDSDAMLAAARSRLENVENVELRRGRLEQLPLDDASLDATVAVLVLHHLADPFEAIREAARVLRAGGKILLVDMLAHDHEDYRQTMGHVWLGFEADQIRAWLDQTGFERIRIQPLTAEPEAKGPTLFAATATKSEIFRAH